MNVNTLALGTVRAKRNLWTLALCLAVMTGCGGGDELGSSDAPVDEPIAGDVAEQQVAAELAGSADATVAVKDSPTDVAKLEQLLADAASEQAVADAVAAPASEAAADADAPAAAKAGGTDVTAQKHGHYRPAKTVNPVVRWNELALDAVRSGSLSDTQAARLYAMVNVAMYDAVNGIETRNGGKRAHALVSAQGAPRGASLTAAASAAAKAVLAQMRPALAATYQAQHATDLSSLRRCDETDAGVAWGTMVGNKVVALRQNDGSTPAQTQDGNDQLRRFRASWSGVQFRNLAPFAIDNPSRYVPSGPPQLNTHSYSDAFNQVRTLGSKGIPNAQFLETFQFWASNAGTSQPAGEWIKVALLIQRKKPLSVPDSARLMALLGMALSDAVAPTITSKFNFHHWRPFHAIREADVDGNLKTAGVTGWEPRGGSIGGSPEYVSGHSSFAGAGTTILRGFFCEDNISFTLLSDGAVPLGFGARRYSSFSQVEAEAGISRILGGVHFQFSNEDGLKLGRGVAKEILNTTLLRTRGETHHRGCPK